jgi:hypothetical protein
MKSLFFILLMFGQATYAVSSEISTSQSSQSTKSSVTTKPLPSSTQGKYLAVKAHGQCNEIRQSDAEPFRWVDGSSGGSSTITSLFERAKEGFIDNVAFGKSDKISLHLKGKNLVPDSINETARHATAYTSLGNPDGFVGRMISLVEPWGSDKIVTLDNKEKKQPIHMAAFYINKNSKAASSVVQCSYIPGDLPVDQIENDAKCFWIDYDSRGSNGKPYCW